MRKASSKTRNIERARALVYKVAEGRSAEAMVARFARYIDDGALQLRNPPHPNSISNWMNDERLTPILENVLELTAKPFRKVECAGIVDSSKMSQMRTAHSRYVEYGDDAREKADWMKMHTLVGVESSICMAVMFSGSSGDDTADIKFALPLIDKVANIFNVKALLADKAYLSVATVGGLWERGVRSIIPVKKRWDPRAKAEYVEPVRGLIERYDNRQAEFHDEYRFRVKVEAFFSVVKRLADGFCWSRGRPRKDANGTSIPVENSREPCTAWINETLCKLIYINLRITVTYEAETGYEMDYIKDPYFPEPKTRIIEAEYLK